MIGSGAVRILGALLVTTLLATVSATTSIDRSLADLVERADLIVYGQVREVEAETGEDERVRTRVVLDVDRDLTEPGAPRDEVVLRFAAVRPGEELAVEGVPNLQPGERVLVFAYDDADSVSPIVGVWQGLWRLGPSGLSDERGRLLTPTLEGLASEGEGGDLTEVLDALEDVLSGEAELAVEATGSPAGDTVPEPDDPAGGALPDGTETDPTSDAGAASEGAAANTDGAARADAADGTEDRTGTDEAVEAADERVVRLRPPEDEVLRNTVVEAAGLWRAAGAEIRVEWDENAADAIRSADPEPFGPDAITLTLRGESSAGVEILVRSDAAASATGAVAYELAGLLGAPREEDGLLSGRFPPGGGGAPTADDAARLRASGERSPGDLDADGDVDFYDLVAFGEAYGRSGARLAADLDGSGEVDDADLELLRDRYRFLPPSPEPPPDWTPADAN